MTESDPRTVVGIGASAGGLEAFGQLLHNLPVDTGMAFVLVQHLDPHHESILPALLSSRTGMPVIQVKEGASVRANNVYVIPPNANLTISEGALHVSPRADTGDRYRPVDIFFASLALDQRANSIGVILSGTASDGALGLRAIKAEGGITFAQDETAQFDGMPRSAIDAGVTDFVLSPERIAIELAAIAGHPYRTLVKSPDAALPIGDDPAIDRLLSALRTATGVDFSQYKIPTVQRRIMRRMVMRKSDDLELYLETVLQDPAEMHALFRDLLINVTEFFRDPAVFEALKEKAFPVMLRNRKRGQPIRVWVPGCSSGEEVYSLAISLVEYQASANLDEQIQIFGTDVSEEAIDKARNGMYSEAVAASVSPERLQRFFTKMESGYQINRAIREMCVFSRQDVTKDPPLSRMDLISCRNLLIYLGQNLQKRVFSIFLYALQPDGCLLLGASETPNIFSELFVIADGENKIYGKKLTVSQPAFDLPSRMAAFPPFATDPAPREYRPIEEAPVAGTPQRYIDRMLLARYAPSGFLVDKNFKIVEFRGDVRPYLGPAAGDAELNVASMVIEDLTLHVQGALKEVAKKNAGIRLEDIAIRDLDRLRRVTIAVTPISIAPLERHYLVLFEEQNGDPAPAAGQRGAEVSAPVDGDQAHARILHLESELAATRQYLQTIIEELRSTNEEAQSTNEELQSTNEELQTAKEELQSSNEELTTLNAEMNGRNLEVSEANNDLLNLLSSMNVPIVMLDRDLRIRRYTPISEKVLSLIPTDVGRPLSDLRSRVNIPDLERMLRDVIETLEPREQDVQDQDGRWYTVRMRPYRTMENRIDGVVLQLLDIDQIKRSLEQVRLAFDYANAVVDTIREPLVVLNQDLTIETANQSFYQMFLLPAHEVSGRSIFEVGAGLWDFPKVHQLLDSIASGETRLRDVEMEHDFKVIGRKTMLLNARKIVQESGAGRILLALDDITERKMAAEARYRQVFEAAKDGILILDAASGEITDVNPFAEQLFGYPRAELLERKLWEAPPLAATLGARQIVAQIRERGIARFPDLNLEARGGLQLEIEAVGAVYDEGGRKMIQFNLRDVTDRKRFERQLEHTQKLESLGLLAGGIAHDFNNLLTGVMGNASLVLAEMQADNPSRALLREIVRCGERASDLTRQMLAYAGKGLFRSEHIDLNQLIREISSLVRASLPKTVEINLILAPDLPALEGDSGQIQQLIMNLVINGGEAVPEGQSGSVTVRTEVRDFTAAQIHEYVEGGLLEAGRYLVLEVADTGSGMDETTRSKIFDPFFTTKFTGRGLGLAAALGIIRGHHGAIRIHTQLGLGANFEVVFPASASKPAWISPKAQAVTQPGSGTLLVVDDEEALRRLAQAGLERHGYRVILAGNGAEAVQIFRARHDEIALVLLDKTMPIMGGEDALVEVRKIDPKVPIILSSGYSQTTEPKLARFLQKPYSMEALLDAIRSELSTSRPDGPEVDVAKRRSASEP